MTSIGNSEKSISDVVTATWKGGRAPVWSALIVSAVLAIGLGTSASYAASCEGGDDHSNPSSFACGNSDTFSPHSVAIGEFAQSGEPDTTDTSNVAVGFDAHASGSSVALGSETRAGDTSNGIEDSKFHTAVGNGAEAGQVIGAQSSTALGTFAKANASYATVAGANSTANFDGSMALGANVGTTRENQVAIGNGNNTYTLAGVASQASIDAQGGPTYLMTTDGNGNLAASTFDTATLEALPAQVSQNTTAISNLNTTVSSHTTQINANTAELADHETRITSNTNAIAVHTTQIADLDTRVTTNTNNITQLDGRVGALETGFQDLGSRISENRTEARAGTALALATAGLRYDDRPGKLSLAGGFGNFKGQSGLALGLGYNPSLDFRLNGAISATTNHGDVGVSLGASWTLN
ncbi:MAG: YadA-like family protein [Mesorhizobium sp.]|nr:YadA-like family protein [Mesorhizobium sp.]